MKVAFLLGSLNRGGTETLLLSILKNLKSDQFNAIVLYRKSGTLETEIKNTRFPVIKISDQKSYFSYLKELKKSIISNDVNIVHAQQPLDALNAFLVCFGMKIPIILTLHGYDFFDKRLLSKLLLRIILPLTNVNFYVSQAQKEYYTKKYFLRNKNQKVLFNGIPLNEFIQSNNSKKISENNLRKQLNIEENTLLLGCVGNFNEVRDQFTICKFLKLLQNETDNFHFVFVGGKVNNVPYFFDECVNFCDRNNLTSNVSFLGTRNDVSVLVSQFDAFVYSTNHDTFGIAVVEAMSVNVPVFVNDWIVMKEITDNGKYATLFRTKDEVDLYEKFLLFLHDKSQFLKKAQDASIHVLDNFSIEKHIENLTLEYLKFNIQKQ